MKIFTFPTSDKIIKKTAELVKEVISSNKKCVIFSEDKINLSLELEIARALGGGYFDINVFTFRRYVHAVSPSDKILSQESSVMLIRKILTELANGLTCFKASSSGPNMALTLYELISQLKSAKVTPNDLLKLINGSANIDGALSSKLNDVYYVYNKYCETVNASGFYDRNDYLSLMPQTVKNDENIKDAVVILSGFSSITRQRFDVFEAINQTASEVLAVVPYHETGNLYTGETYSKLLEIDPSATVIPSETDSFEAETLRKYLFSPDVLKNGFEPFETDKISLYTAYDTAEEVEFIAKDIICEIRNNQKRFKDISLAVGSISETLPHVKRIFSDYNIPFYVERQTLLSEHPLASLIISVLDLARRGVQVSDFVKVIGNATLIPNKEIADGLITAIYKNAISRFAIKNKFTFEHENLAVFEEIREKIVAVSEKLIKSRRVGEFASALRSFLNVFDFKNNLTELGKRLESCGELVSAEFNNGALLKIFSVIEEMEKVLGDVSITALDFKHVLQSGFNATKVGLIPILNDAVYVGEIKDVKFKGSKILYCASLSGDVPSVKADTSLLTDGDLNVLDGFDVIIAPKIKLVNDRERESVIMALTSFEEKLKLSYPLVNTLQSAVHKSELIKSITQIFKIKTLNKQLIEAGIENGIAQYKKYEVGSFASKDTAIMRIASLYAGYKAGVLNNRVELHSFYEALKGVDDELLRVADELYETPSLEANVDKKYLSSIEKGEISASTLETFFSCPYKNFGQRVLGLKDTETGEIRANETGLLLHAVLEKYVAKFKSVTDKISSDRLVEQVFEEILTGEDSVKYNSTNPMLKFQLVRAVKEAKKVCFEIFETQAKTKFIPTEFEKKFGEGKKTPAIKLHPKTGDIGVGGTIDRVDYYGDNVRIIDYKTGSIDSSSEAFYTGNKLQLYLYMNAVIDGDKKPAGAYYYSVNDDFSSGEKGIMLTGKTLGTDDIVTASDIDIKTAKKSNLINVKYVKGDKFSAYSHIFTEKEFDSHLEYSLKVSENCVDDMRSGFISATPYEGACTYCKYCAMCGFSEKEGHIARKENAVTKDTIVKALEVTSDVESKDAD